MRHPIDGFTIPAPMVRVLEHLASREDAEYLEAWELQLRHAALLYDFSADLLAARAWKVPSDASEACGELHYENTPFELSPVSWNGGDGLHYDWVVHAPELDLSDFPMVSFAPVDEDGPDGVGAVVLLKNMRAWAPDDASIVARMREAYLALGRPMHAARAAMWMEKRE